MNTITKSQILEADKLATLYAPAVAPVAVVTPEIAAAFGMENLPNVRIEPAPVETAIPEPSLPPVAPVAVASVETPQPESAPAHGYKIRPNIRAIDANGETTIERGEFWDAITQTCIESGATEQKPLRLGNVDFWRDGNETCYSIPANQWEAQKVADQLAEILTAKKIAIQPESRDKITATPFHRARLAYLNSRAFGVSRAEGLRVAKMITALTSRVDFSQPASQPSAGGSRFKVESRYFDTLSDATAYEQAKRAKDGIFRNIREVKSRKPKAAKPQGWSASLPGGNFGEICRSIKLAAVKPIETVLPEPSTPFEVVSLPVEHVASEPEPVTIKAAPVVRCDEAGQVINGTIREAAGPVTLPPIPPRPGGALATMLEAGAELAKMMAPDFKAPQWSNCAIY